MLCNKVRVNLLEYCNKVRVNFVFFCNKVKVTGLLGLVFPSLPTRKRVTFGA